MNIMVNYDVFDAIKDIKEGFTISKLYRNNKTVEYGITPVLCAAYFAFFKEDALKYASYQLIDIILCMMGINLIGYKLFGDVYKEKAEERIKELVSLLGRMNVNTSYDLLKDTECYHKVYNLVINKNKIPRVLESKYLLVPSYDYNGEIVDTSILQEHIIGSKKYVISIGTPKKVLKLAYNSNG